jgi:hypothetical protein
VAPGWLWVIVPVLVIAVVIGLTTGNVLAWWLGGIAASVLLVTVIFRVRSRH